MTNLIFLSPIFSFLILGIILFYLLKKYRQIKITTKDYILLIPLERKINRFINKDKIEILNKEIKEVLINIFIKILQRLKTESLKIQIWAEYYLNKLKRSKEQ